MSGAPGTPPRTGVPSTSTRLMSAIVHNKRAPMLKALLLVRGDEDIVVINGPW
jgi:hypothetical protein